MATPLKFFKSSCTSGKIANANRMGARSFECMKGPSGVCECQISTRMCFGQKNCYPATLKGCEECTSKCTSNSCGVSDTLLEDVLRRQQLKSESGSKSVILRYLLVSILVIFVIGSLLALYYRYK